MESHKFKVQVIKNEQVVKFRGLPYFETEGSVSEVLLKAKEYMLKNREK